MTEPLPPPPKTLGQPSRWSSPALRIALGYFIVATLWIKFSDTALAAWLPPGALRERVEVYKGWFFVTITAWLLYKILAREFKRQDNALRDSRLANRALLDSEARLRIASEVGGVGVYDQDHLTNTIHVSPLLTRIEQIPEDHDGLARLALFMSRLEPSDRVRFEEALRKAVDPQGDGLLTCEVRYHAPSGEVRWLALQSQTWFDEVDGVRRAVRTIGASSDITERKQLEDKFQRAQRLEAVGTLASGVAHDLNNILAPILLAAPLLQAKLPHPADRKLLDLVESCATRGAQVVRQLLTFSRGASGVRGPVQPAHVLQEIADIVRETFPREIGITVNIAAGLGPVVADVTQLHQVMMNLCVNARDAMPTGGQLTIACRPQTLSAEDALRHVDARAGSYIVLSVIDTGTGINPEHLRRIFDPFFTTKPIGKGTGLGLSSVLGIAKGHGGFVTVNSTPGRGTEFEVYLPAPDQAAAKSANTPVEIAPPRRHETILVVDDEPAVLETTTHVLQTHGYTVLTARNGRDGLREYLRHRERIRLVVTDVMMPEMGGAPLVRALRTFDANLPIIVVSGLDQDLDADPLADLAVNARLSKPYTPNEILDALEHHLPKPEAH